MMLTPRDLGPSRLRRLALLLLVPAVLLLPALTPRALGSDDDDLVHGTLREFYRSGKYVLYIAGEAQSEARIYHSRRAGAFLVLGSSYGKPLLFQPREKAVCTVGEAQVVKRPDKGVDLLADTTIKSLGSLRLDRGGMTVKADGLVARLQPQPYLLGAKRAAAVLLHSPEYERAGAAYRPNAADIKRIKAGTKDIEITVFFGSWCPTCRRLLPRILRVDEAIAGSKVTIIYYGLPKGRAMRRDAAARKHGIKRIPTAVVTVNGRRASKITSRGWNRPEQALAALMR